MQDEMVIRGGTVLDPVAGSAQRRDLYIRGGRLSPSPPAGGDPHVIPAEGCYVSPGFIDAHGHFYTHGH